MAPTHVIIDTDPGIDDTFALLVALAAQPEDIIIDALTIVMGNHSDLSILGENACRILSWCGASNIPVVLGASSPMKHAFTGESGIRVHGEDGFGNICETFGDTDLSPLKKYEGQTAADFIIAHTKASADPVTLITLGPMTNIGLAVEKDPTLPQRAKNIYCMGGAVNVRGNKTPIAEANFNNDGYAAHLALTSGFHVTLTALNITRQLSLSDDFRKDLPKTCGVLGQVLKDASDHYVTLLRSWGQTSIPIHDPTAVISLLRPELFESEQVYCDVEHEGSLTAGVVVADWMGHWGDKPANVTLLTKVNEAEYMKFFTDSLAKAWQLCEKAGVLQYDV